MLQIPDADILVDEQLAARLIAEQYPDLADQPIRLLDVGWDNYMFKLGESLLLRFPRRELAVPLLQNEQRWLPEIAARLPIAISVPVRFGSPGAGYPWPWNVLPYLSGKSANIAAPENSQAEKLGRCLKALHTPAPADAPRNDLRGVPLQKRAVLVEDCMERLAKRTELIRPAIRTVWQEALAAPPARDSRWLHGDLHARNVIVNDGVITGIIDWGDLTSGDVATDLASTWMLFSAPSAQRNVLEAYAPTDEATIRRAKGWAVFFGVVLAESGLENDEQLWLMGRQTLRNLLA